eukprot:g10912.t1
MSVGGSASTSKMQGSSTCSFQTCISQCAKSAVKGTSRALASSIFFPFVFLPVVLALSLHVLWFAYDVRLFAIRKYGYVIHEFDPWFNYRATEHLELELRTSYDDLKNKKDETEKEKAAALPGNVTYSEHAIRDHFLDSKVVDLSTDELTEEDEKEMRQEMQNSLIGQVATDTLAYRLMRKYFNINTWHHAVNERFFKWFDHMVWFPLGRPVGTTIYPGMQLTTVALYRMLKVTNRVGRQQNEVISKLLLDKAKEGKLTEQDAPTPTEPLSLDSTDTTSDPDFVSNFVKRILYSCRTQKKKPRNCILRYQKIFSRVYASTSPLWGGATGAGASSKKKKGKEQEAPDDQWRPDRLFAHFVENYLTGGRVTNETVASYLDVTYTILESKLSPVFSGVVNFLAPPTSNGGVGKPELFFSKYLQSSSLLQFCARFFFGYSEKEWKSYVNLVKKEYKNVYNTLSRSVSKNFSFLLYDSPQRLLQTFTHPWTLTEVACHLPALFGSIATLFAVAQPIAHYDWCRHVTRAVTFIAAMFFMSVIPAHAQRSVGGGFDNECIAIAPMCACGYFWSLSLRDIEVQSKVNSLRLMLLPFPVPFSQRAFRLLAAFLAGCSHAFMAAGWGGYVFLINLVGLHAAAVFFLERTRIFGTGAVASPSSKLIVIGGGTSNYHNYLQSSGSWNALYEAYTLFYIVGTYGAMLTPVVHWAPLCSLEQLFPLATFVLFQIVKLCDLLGGGLSTVVGLVSGKLMSFAFFTQARGKHWVRLASMISVMVMAFGVAIISLDVQNSRLLKVLEMFFDPLSGRVKALFGAHATKTGNPLIDSVSEHQPGNPAALWRMLDRCMYIAPVGVAFLAFDLFCLIFSFAQAALGEAVVQGRKNYMAMKSPNKGVKSSSSSSSKDGGKTPSGSSSTAIVPVEDGAKRSPGAMKLYAKELVRSCFQLEEGTPVATGGLYVMIFGIATYAFALKMARLMIFLGPTAPILSAVAVGRVAQWILAPIRYLTVRNKDLGYDAKLDGSSTTGYVRASNGTGSRLNLVDDEDLSNANDQQDVEGLDEGSSKVSKNQKKKERDSAKLVGGGAVGGCSTGCAASCMLGKGGVKLGLLSARAIATLLMVLRYGFGSHMEHFLGAGYNMIEYGLSHPQIVSTLRDGTLKDDYREAYLWIRDNTKEDARILSWWDYGYQLAGISKRVTVADGNTWNHEHLAFLGLTITSPVEESHIIMRHWADYVLVWNEEDLSKATHMARIANSVYKGHCYDKMCWQFGWEGQGQPSKMMANSFVYHATTGYQDNDPAFAGRFKPVFQSKFGAVRIFKIAKSSMKSKRLAFDVNRWKCDAPGSWYCPGDYSGQLSKLREIGFHGFGWTITGDKAEESKAFTVTTTTTVAGQGSEEEDEDEEAKGKGKGNEPKEKLKKEFTRYMGRVAV